jgi:hypothetical protein
MTPLGGFLSRNDLPISDDVYFRVNDAEVLDAHDVRR